MTQAWTPPCHVEYYSTPHIREIYNKAIFRGFSDSAKCIILCCVQLQKGNATDKGVCEYLCFAALTEQNAQCTWISNCARFDDRFLLCFSSACDNTDTRFIPFPLGVSSTVDDNLNYKQLIGCWFQSGNAIFLLHVYCRLLWFDRGG